MVVGSAPARELVGDFSDRPIELRAWMITYNTVLLVTHLVLLLVLAIGTSLIEAADAATGRCKRVSVWLLSAAMLLTAAFAIMPWVIGTGPFAPDSAAVKGMRVLVFLPPIVRTCALGVLAWSLGRHAVRDRRVAVVLAGVDVALCAATWSATPKAVIALLHPCATQPPKMLPLLLLLTTIAMRAKHNASDITSR